MRTLAQLPRLVVPALLLACGDPSSPASGSHAAGMSQVANLQPDGPVLAEVGPGWVTEEDFAQAVSRTPGVGSSPSLEQRKELLDKIVTEEALFQEAAAEGLYRDPKVRKILINLLLREKVYTTVRAEDFSDAELRSYYEAHAEEFVVPEKIQLKRIFVKYGEERSPEQAKELADDLARQLRADPGRFKDLAEKHSEDPYKRRGGDLGYVSREGKPGVDPAVVERAFELTPGVVADPFEAGGGYNVVLVANKRDRVERTFEQMKGSVMRKLKNDRYQELTKQYIDEVRAKYPVTVDEELLGKASVKPRLLPDDEAGGHEPGADEADEAPEGEEEE